MFTPTALGDDEELYRQYMESISGKPLPMAPIVHGMSPASNQAYRDFRRTSDQDNIVLSPDIEPILSPTPMGLAPPSPTTIQQDLQKKKLSEAESASLEKQIKQLNSPENLLAERAADRQKRMGDLAVAQAVISGFGKPEGMQNVFNAYLRQIESEASADKQQEQKIYDQFLKDKLEAPFRNPNSKESVSARDDARRKLGTLAEAANAQGRTEFGSAFAQMAKDIEGKNALEIQKIMESADSMQKSALGYSQADAQRAKISQSGEAQKQDAEFKRQQLNLQERELTMKMQAMEKKDAEMKGRLHLTGDQSKVVAGLADIMQKDAAMDELSAILEDAIKNNKNFSGYGYGHVNSAKGAFNATANPEFISYAALLTRLFAEDRKTFAGVSVTPQESEQLKGMIPNIYKDSDTEIYGKVMRAKEWLNNKYVLGLSQLRVNDKNEPIDQSMLTRHIFETSQMLQTKDAISKMKQEGLGIQTGGAVSKPPGGSEIFKPSGEIKEMPMIGNDPDLSKMDIKETYKNKAGKVFMHINGQWRQMKEST